MPNKVTIVLALLSSLFIVFSYTVSLAFFSWICNGKWSADGRSQVANHPPATAPMDALKSAYTSGLLYPELNPEGFTQHDPWKKTNY